MNKVFESDKQVRKFFTNITLSENQNLEQNNSIQNIEKSKADYVSKLKDIAKKLDTAKRCYPSGRYERNENNLIEESICNIGSDSQYDAMDMQYLQSSPQYIASNYEELKESIQNLNHDNNRIVLHVNAISKNFEVDEHTRRNRNNHWIGL